MHEGADLVKLCQNIKGEILDHINIVLLVLKAIHKTDVLGIAKKEGFINAIFLLTKLQMITFSDVKSSGCLYPGQKASGGACRITRCHELTMRSLGKYHQCSEDKSNFPATRIAHGAIMQNKN